MNASFLRISCLALVALGLSACTPQAPPTDEPPKPQAAEASQLRDAIQRPIDKAKSVEGTLQEAENKQRAELDAAEN